MGRKHRQLRRTLKRRLRVDHASRPSLDDGMRICATEAETADARDARTVADVPRREFGRNFQRQTVGLNVRIEFLEISLRRNLAVLHHQQHFDQAGRAGRGFQVPDISLYRRHVAGGSIGAAIAEHAVERRHFDRVAERRAGAVRFDVRNLFRLHACLRKHLRTHSICDGPFGAVIPDVLPS